MTLAFFSKEIDVIIAPGFTFPAPPVKHPARLVPAISYTAAYNVLDYPVGSVPITRVIPQDEVCRYLLIYSWINDVTTTHLFKEGEDQKLRKYWLRKVVLKKNWHFVSFLKVWLPTLKKWCRHLYDNRFQSSDLFDFDIFLFALLTRVQ